jgi:hypothetical protein
MRTYEESHFFLYDFVEPPASTEFSTKTTPEKNLMKVPILISLASALLTSWVLAAPYDELPAQGYRWVTTNGPYAYRSKDDLRQISNKHTDPTGMQMIEELHAYYLIKGAIVQVVLEDAAAGMSQIRSAEIGPDVWTLTRFLSKSPLGAQTARSNSQALKNRTCIGLCLCWRGLNNRNSESEKPGTYHNCTSRQATLLQEEASIPPHHNF